MARASMCIDCAKFGSERCGMLGEVEPTTWTITLYYTECDGSESMFHKVDGEYVCKKCGRPRKSNEYGCECVLTGELEYLRWRGVK